MSGIPGGALPPPGLPITSGAGASAGGAAGSGAAGQAGAAQGAQQGAAQQAQTQSQNPGTQAAAGQQAAQGTRSRSESSRADTARADNARADAARAAGQAAAGTAPQAPPPVRAEGVAQLIALGTNSATIVGQDGAGQPIVRTASGFFLLTDGPKIAPGGLALGQQVTLRLVPMPATASGGVSFSLLPGSASPGAAAAGMAAGLVRPEALASQALARFGILPAGSTAAPPPGMGGVHSLAATFLAAAPGSAGSWTPGQAFAAGVQVTGQAGTAQAAGAQGAASPADPGGAMQLTGRVLGAGPSGGTLVQTSAGTFLLQTGQPWSTGLTVALTLNPGETLAQALPSAAQSLGRGWPALDAALAHLAAQQPGLVIALRNGPLPGPNSGFATAFLAFISALRGGGLQAWLGGEAARGLERGPFGSQLADDLSFFSMLLDDRLDGDWRMLPLPYADGEKLRQLTVYMRDRRKKQGQNDPGARFVVALDLTSTGAMQIDGLVRDKRLDLALRTGKPLSQTWRTDIHGIFEEALAITGMAGQLVFQHGREALLDLPQPGQAERSISA